MHIQKHVVKEVAQNLSGKHLEGEHGALRRGENYQRELKKTHYAIWQLVPFYHSTSTGLRAQFFWTPVDRHIFLLPGESANRSGLLPEREKDTLSLSCCN